MYKYIYVYIIYVLYTCTWILNIPESTPQGRHAPEGAQAVTAY